MINPKSRSTYVSLKNLSQDDRPREKLMVKGRKALSNAEILAILIGSGSTEKSAVELSREILASVENDLDRLARLTIHDLMKFHGIGVAKAVSIAAALELGRRKQEQSPRADCIVTTSADIYARVRGLFQDLAHEEFYIVLMNRGNKIMAIELISKGGFSGTAVDGKLIFKKALEQSASSIALCHNHPSGNLQPSKPDIFLTRKLKAFGEMIDLKVLDHLIVTDKGYFSFKDEEIL